jgi:glutamine cyclotransferase
VSIRTKVKTTALKSIKADQELDALIPSLQSLAREKEKSLAKDEAFNDLLSYVHDMLKQNFYGTYATVEVTARAKHHMQLLMFLYREQGWHVSSLMDDGKEYLRFRDPRSIGV